jgi:hypothetical protein
MMLAFTSRRKSPSDQPSNWLIDLSALQASLKFTTTGISVVVNPNRGIEADFVAGSQGCQQLAARVHLQVCGLFWVPAT